MTADDLATLAETNVASIQNRKKSPPSPFLPDDIIGDVIGSLGLSLSLGSKVRLRLKTMDIKGDKN